MAYPATIDDLADPTPAQPLSSPAHSTYHIALNTVVEALMAKLGIDNSLVSSSVDYKLRMLLPAAGNGSPEGVVIGSPGKPYHNLTDDSHWVKRTGEATTTGWYQLLG